jgi:hypothetical protein
MGLGLGLELGIGLVGLEFRLGLGLGVDLMVMLYCLQCVISVACLHVDSDTIVCVAGRANESCVQDARFAW